MKSADLVTHNFSQLPDGPVNNQDGWNAEYGFYATNNTVTFSEAFQLMVHRTPIQLNAGSSIDVVVDFHFSMTNDINHSLWNIGLKADSNPYSEVGLIQSAVDYNNWRTGDLKFWPNAKEQWTTADNIYCVIGAVHKRFGFNINTRNENGAGIIPEVPDTDTDNLRYIWTVEKSHEKGAFFVSGFATNLVSGEIREAVVSPRKILNYAAWNSPDLFLTISAQDAPDYGTQCYFDELKIIRRNNKSSGIVLHEEFNYVNGYSVQRHFNWEYNGQQWGYLTVTNFQALHGLIESSGGVNYSGSIINTPIPVGIGDSIEIDFDFELRNTIISNKMFIKWIDIGITTNATKAEDEKPPGFDYVRHLGKTSFVGLRVAQSWPAESNCCDRASCSQIGLFIDDGNDMAAALATAPAKMFGIKSCTGDGDSDPLHITLRLEKTDTPNSWIARCAVQNKLSGHTFRTRALIENALLYQQPEVYFALFTDDNVKQSYYLMDNLIVKLLKASGK